MERELGFGILGAGLVAPFHARAIKASRGARLIGFADVNRARAEKLAAEFGGAVFGSLDEMLNHPGLDVVNVALPNHLHADAVIRSAAAGKHVITEKPPAMTLRETDAMIEACRKARVKFACTVQCRVRKAVQAMKKALSEGRFGKLLHADAIMKWYRSTEYYKSDAWRMSRRSGAGVTVQHAFHYIDLLQYLAGPAKRVHARMTNLAHHSIALEDTLLAFLDFQNGAQGVVEASTALWPGTDVRIEINGTDGTAIMVGERIVAWKFRDQRPEDESVRLIGDPGQPTGAGGAADFGYQDHQVVIQNMMYAIRNDSEPVITVESVRPTLEIVLAMYHSAAKGIPVDLPVQDDETIWEWRA